MLTYDLHKRGDHPLYEYLYICIRNDILSGVLKAGDKMPSKRMLARNHNVSVITVENAYEQLIMEGYIRTIEKSGYFVTEIEQMERSGEITANKAVIDHASGTAVKSVAAHDTSKSAGALAATGSAAAQETTGAARIINFTSNHTAYGKFPFSVWARLTRQTLLNEEQSFLRSPMSQGEPALRQAIAGYLQEFRGMTVDPENIVIGAGTEYLYGLVVQLLGRNGMIAVEDPGHLKVSQVYESNGIKVLHIPIDADGFSVEALGRNQVSAIHISPTHHFPTGIVMPAVRRHQILNWAAERDAYVIEDDFDSEFRFAGKPMPTMASLDGTHVIYMNTFSKTLAASVRIAYMILPDALMERFHKRLHFYSSTVCSTEQATLARFIEEGYYGRHINRARNFYRDYRARILRMIEDSPLRELVVIEEHKAGLHFLLQIPGLENDEEFLRRMEGRGVRLAPVSAYCYRPQERYRHRFVFNYANVSPEDMEQALAIMEECLKTW